MVEIAKLATLQDSIFIDTVANDVMGAVLPNRHRSEKDASVVERTRSSTSNVDRQVQKPTEIELQRAVVLQGQVTQAS